MVVTMPMPEQLESGPLRSDLVEFEVVRVRRPDPRNGNLALSVRVASVRICQFLRNPKHFAGNETAGIDTCLNLP